MQQILDFFIRNKNFLLFVTLFSFGVLLTQKAHSGLYTRNIASTNQFTGTIFSWLSNAQTYFTLRNQNEELVEANKKLIVDQINFNRIQQDQADPMVILPEDRGSLVDSLDQRSLNIIRAHVINNSYNKSRNTLTIDKGKKHGVMPDMGVASPTGIVGIITHVSEYFSIAQSILNTSSRVVVKHKHTNHFGTLIWDGQNIDKLTLTEIPKIAPITSGDSLVTDGKSTIFPRGWPVGTVTEVLPAEAQDYLKIGVKPHTDMSNLYHVYLIQRPEAQEIRELENLSQNEL